MITLRRDMFGSMLLPILENPEVKDWVLQEGQKAIDVIPLVRDFNNVVLVDPHGQVALLFHWQGRARYIVHTMATPFARGAYTLNVVRSALHWMFTQTEAEELLTAVPDGNKAALGLVRLIHGRKIFEREGAWTYPDGRLVSVSFWSLSWLDWAIKSEKCQAEGAWFHETLEQELMLLGVGEPQHLADPVHDAVVGATVETIRTGRMDKAVSLYNAWASLAGYANIALVRPGLLDIQTCYLQVRPDGLFDVKKKPERAKA